MKLCESDIRNAIENANYVLSYVCNNGEFTKPYIKEIKITNAKSYWANVRRCDKGFAIRVSKLIELIPNEALAKRRLEETIIHELIHTMPGRMNHGPKFKSICNKVNRVFGDKYKIGTTTDSSDYGVKLEDKPKQKYIITCPDCGKVYYYSRKPKYHISMYNCSVCGKSHLELKEV